tara:strand:+ start:254 stop:523 length:270 start_codon:yes stop_codon:yes gene_type:complete
MANLFSFKNFIIFIILVVTFLTIKDDGVLEYQSLSNDHKQLLLKLNQLSIKLNDLKNENLLLQQNNQYIEKIAREQYFYIFPKETIIHF